MTAHQKKTTISTADKALLRGLIEHTASTAHQSTTLIPQSKPTPRYWTLRASYHSPSTRDYSDTDLESYLEDLEWQAIINNPRIQHGILRLANEAQEQIAAGEFEEGGFAIE